MTLGVSVSFCSGQGKGVRSSYRPATVFVTKAARTPLSAFAEAVTASAEAVCKDGKARPVG